MKILQKHPILPYILPFLLFILFTGLTPYIPGTLTYAYPLKTVLVALTLALCWPLIPELKAAPKLSHIVYAIALGILVFVIWIFDPAWYPHLGKSVAFDPLVNLPQPYSHGWIAIRILGACLLVPIIEEVFWRGFVLRWLIHEDFQKVPLGSFTWQSFIICSILFGVEHHEWLVGIVAGVAYAYLLYKTKNLWACILSHGVTNLLLGIYVVMTQRWYFW